jgi:hypothetical protein
MSGWISSEKLPKIKYRKEIIGGKMVETGDSGKILMAWSDEMMVGTLFSDEEGEAYWVIDDGDFIPVKDLDNSPIWWKYIPSPPRSDKWKSRQEPV